MLTWGSESRGNGSPEERAAAMGPRVLMTAETQTETLRNAAVTMICEKSLVQRRMGVGYL